MDQNYVETLVANLQKPVIGSSNSDVDVPFAYIPPGWNTQNLEGFLQKPLRIETHVRFVSAEGFVTYVNEFKSGATAVFASETEIDAVLDYHKPNAPSRCTHAARYRLQLTTQWQKWAQLQGKNFSQEEFACFIEDVMETIEKPAAADLLPLIKQFKSKSSSQFVSVLNDNGVVASFELKKDATAAAGATEVEFPRELTIVIRAFEGVQQLGVDDAFRLKVRLKYTISANNDRVTFSYSIPNFEAAQLASWTTLVNALRERLQTRLYVGGAFNGYTDRRY